MKFSTEMLQMGNNTGIEVPAEVVEALGAGKRPAVVVDVNGYRYRSTVAPSISSNRVWPTATVSASPSPAT